MTVELDREYPLQEGRTARYYKVGDWDFDYITNADGSVDPASDANIEYAERAIAAWTEWRDWLKENLPEPEPREGEIWWISTPSGAYASGTSAWVSGGCFVFKSGYSDGLDRLGFKDAWGWTMKRIWPEESA